VKNNACYEYDSLGGDTVSSAAQKLANKIGALSGNTITATAKTTPQQADGVNCGTFVLAITKRLLDN